jgi:plastocyanin
MSSHARLAALLTMLVFVLAPAAAFSSAVASSTAGRHGESAAKYSGRRAKCARRARRHHARRARRCRVKRHEKTSAPVAPVAAPVTPTAPAAPAVAAAAPSLTAAPAPIIISSPPETKEAAPEGGEAEPPSIPHVQVSAVEYSFSLSRTSVPAGKVVLEFVNNGQDEHNLHLEGGEGPLSESIGDTPSKGVSDLHLEMNPGSYTLFCSLPTHESRGMKATLTVE